MKALGQLYTDPTELFIANNDRVVCYAGLKLTVVNDCLEEGYLHEKTHYNRPNLFPKQLKANTKVIVLGCWMNMYGTFIKCKDANDDVFDVRPNNLRYERS